jgi:predicted Zn-dependent protease
MLLYKSLDPKLNNQQRGAAFARFSEKLFGEVFELVERDFWIENGEVVLVFNISAAGPWWSMSTNFSTARASRTTL